MKRKNVNRYILVTIAAFLLLGFSQPQANAQVKGRNVTEVQAGKGGKVQVIIAQVGPKTWKMTPADRSRVLGTLTETARDEWSVYLADSAKRGNITINLFKKTVTGTFNGKAMDLGAVLKSSSTPIKQPAASAPAAKKVATRSATVAETDPLGPSPLTPNQMAHVMQYIALKVSAIRVPYCYRKSETRGAGKPLSNQCAPGLEKNGALCYPKCRSNYKGAGPVCWEKCAPGFRDIGAFCQKPKAYGTSYPWKSGDRAFSLNGARARCKAANPTIGCVKKGAIIYAAKCKPGFHKVGIDICSPTCPAGQADTGTGCRKKSYGRTAGKPFACRPGMQQGRKTERSGLLCYPICKNRDYKGVGPVCWQQCPNQQPVGCGFGCSIDKGTCASVISDQVISPIMAVVSLATLGSSAAAANAAKAAKQAATVGKKGLGGASAVSKLKDVSKLSQTVLRIKKTVKSAKAWSTVALGGTKNVKKLLKAKKYIQIGMKFYKTTKNLKKEVDLFRTEFSKDFVKQTSPKINAEIIRRFGPKGAEHVRQEWAKNHLSLMFEADAWATAKTVISLASVADPTGLASVVNAYMHPICKESAVFPSINLLHRQ